MLIKKLSWCSLMLLLFAVTGCGPSYYYKYAAPSSAEGISCVQRCTATRNTCRQAAVLEQKNAQALAIANERNYQYCAAGRSKEDARKYCGWSGDGFSQYDFNDFPGPSCEDDFNQCFEICGGTIERVLQQ